MWSTSTLPLHRYVVLPVVFFQVFNLGILRPSVPYLLVQAFHDSKSKAALASGVADGIGALVAFVVMPALGHYSDTHGRRPVISFTVLLASLPVYVLCLYPFLPPIVTLSLFFVSQGLAKINSISSIYAYTADLTHHKDRSVAFGHVSVCVFAALTLGPAVAYVANTMQATFIIAAILSTLNLIYTVLLLPESNPALTSFFPLADNDEACNTTSTYNNKDVRNFLEAANTNTNSIPPTAATIAVRLSEVGNTTKPDILRKMSSRRNTGLNGGIHHSRVSFAPDCSPTLSLVTQYQATVAAAATKSRSNSSVTINAINSSTNDVLLTGEVSQTQSLLRPPTVSNIDLRGIDEDKAAGDDDEDDDDDDEDAEVSSSSVYHPLLTLSFMFRRQVYVALFVLVLLEQVAVYGVGEIFLLYLMDALKFSRQDNIDIMFLTGLFTCLCMMGVLPFLTQFVSLSERAVIQMSLIGYITYVIGLAAVTSKLSVCLLLSLYAISAMAFPMTGALLSNVTPHHDNGLAQGALSGIRCLALGLGPLVFSMIFSFYSSSDHLSVGADTMHDSSISSSSSSAVASGIISSPSPTPPAVVDLLWLEVPVSSTPFLFAALLVVIALFISFTLPGHETATAIVSHSKLQRTDDDNNHLDKRSCEPLTPTTPIPANDE